MKKSVIFDLDGTLWDATGITYKIWNAVFEKHEEITLRLDQATFASLMGKTMEEIGITLFPNQDINWIHTLLDEISIEETDYLSKNGAYLFDGVEDVLKTLSEKYELCIVSNSQDGYVQAFLQAHNLGKYITDIEMSGRTGKHKGMNIQMVIERNQYEKAIYVGDTDGDERGANFAKIPFIYASYGFGKVNHPDAIITSIKELPECAKQFLE